MVMELVHRSQWFSFEPLPDGCYEITVKEEFKTQMLFMTPGKFRMKEKGAEPIEKKS